MNTEFKKKVDGEWVIKERKNILLSVTRIVKGREVVLKVVYPTDEMLMADGWERYIAPKEVADTSISRMNTAIRNLVVKQWNERTDITNEEALDYMVIVYQWSDFVGKELPVGKIVEHDGKLWRVRQAHTAIETYAPSMATAALFEVIEKEHTGEADDPIPYTAPMAIFAGKYYSEDGATYLCTRDSGTALSHSLKDLINLYVAAV